uniref:Uncharacterized protein n=1 Tax=Magallana gigas TaxID=29159 RepID=A0A8W8N1B1_MAGGI
MGRCPRNVNDWLRALVIVTLYNFVHGLASPTEVLKSSMQYLSNNQTGPSSNPTIYPRTSDVSLQYIQSSSKVFTRLDETTGDWYGISSSKYTSDPEFSQNQEYSDIVVLLEKPPSATEITSLVNAVDKQTPSSNYDQIWTSSSALVRGSLAEGPNKNDTTLGSSEPRTNNSNSRMDSIPKLNSMSTQLSNINSVISSNRLDIELAPTKSSKASLLPHPKMFSLQENQDTAEMSHSYSTSESFKSYSKKEALSYSLQTSFSGIDHSFSSVDKFVGDQTLYPSSVIFPSNLLLNEILSPIPTPTYNTFPSAPMESLVVIEWPTSVHKENATRLFSSRKKSSAKDSSSKTQGNFKSTAHASDHTVFPKPKLSTEHALPFKVSSMNTSKHSLTESHNSSLPYGLQQSFNIETYVLLTEDHRTTVPIQVIKSNKGGSGNIAENEITSTPSLNYKSASSISTTYLEFYTAYYVEDSSYDTHLLQPSETTILGLSDVLDSSKSTETIPTTAHFHSTIDLSLFSSVPSGESDRIAYSPFEKETESTRTGRELSWSDTYSNNIFSNVIESDTMTALPNKQIQTSAIMSSSVQTHRITPTSTHKEENTTKAVERVLHSLFNTEFKTSSADALESSSQVKEPKTTAILYSTNTNFPSDTNDQLKTASESTPLYFYDEINATPINTIMFQSVHVGTSEQIVSPMKQTIHSSVTLSYYSSILQDLQSSYHSVPGEGDHWTTTKEPLHISTDNSAELLSALAASEEAIDAQSKQTGEQMSSVFSKTLVKTMSSQLASSAEYNLLSSFKENKLSSETHAIYAYQSKLPTTVDDLLSTASATSNATTTKPSALIHSSFGDLVGYSLHSTIGGYFSSGVLNSTVIKLTVPTMESSVNYDKTSSNFTSEETPLNTKMSRFANRRGVENRTVKPLDTTDYSIMSSVNYNIAEIASQSILSSMPMYANTQIQNLSHAETLPAQSSIETKYMYQVTSDLRTTYNNLLSSYPIYVPTISASFSSVHSHLIDDAVRTMSQVVMSVAGSNVQSQVNTDYTSSSSVIATNADLSVKVQEESDVFDRESSGVYFSSLYSSDRPLLEVSFSRGVTPFETKYVGSSMIKDMLGTHEIAVTNAMIEQTTFTPEILQTPSLTVMFDSDTIVAVTSPSITVYPYPENNLLVIEIDVKLGIDISQEHFKEKLEEGLTTIYVEGMSQRRRRSSSKTRIKDTGIFVKIKDIKRKSGERVEIIFRVTYNGIVVSASLAEMAFQKMSDIKMSAILGYPVVAPVSRLTSRKEPPSDDSWWGGLFNPLVITLIAVPTSIVVIATVIAIVYQCRSKSIQRYPSVPSQMDSLYKHNLVVDVENGDVRNRRIFYDYPSDDEFSMTSSEAFNEIKHKYSQSMHSKIRNFEKLNTKNHFYNQLEKKPSDVVRNKVTFGLDGDDNKCQCTKTDSNESNDSGVIVDAPKSPAHEQNNLKLDVPSVNTTHIVQSQSDSQAASKSVILQNPYPVKKKSNLVNLSGERVTSWVFMGENTNSANECIPESCDSKQIMTASDSVNRIAHDSNYIPPQHGVECQASDQGALPGVQDHFYETLNRKEPSKCDNSTGTQTQSGLSGSDGFEYLEPLRQLLLAVEQQRRRVPPVDQFLNDETVFKQPFQGMCNLEHRTPILPSVKSPSLPLGNTTDGYNCESDNNCESDSKNESDVCSIGSDKRTQNETHERKERQFAKGIDTKCEEISRADSFTYDQPFLYPVGRTNRLTGSEYLDQRGDHEPLQAVVAKKFAHNPSHDQ